MWMGGFFEPHKVASSRLCWTSQADKSGRRRLFVLKCARPGSLGPMFSCKIGLHESEATLGRLLVPATRLQESCLSRYVPNNDPCSLDCSDKIVMPGSLRRLLSVCRRVQLWHLSFGDGNGQAGDRHQQQRGEEESTGLGKAESSVCAVFRAVA
jgi:hypothetical protein